MDDLVPKNTFDWTTKHFTNLVVALLIVEMEPCIGTGIDKLMNGAHGCKRASERGKNKQAKVGFSM